MASSICALGDDMALQWALLLVGDKGKETRGKTMFCKISSIRNLSEDTSH